MTIGIIGAGHIGLAVAKTLARTGIAATIANSRGPDSLEEIVRPLGPTIKAGTREEAASADIVFIAVNWSKLPAAVADLPAWGGRIVIDANNPIEAPLFKPIERLGRDELVGPRLQLEAHHRPRWRKPDPCGDQDLKPTSVPRVAHRPTKAKPVRFHTGYEGNRTSVFLPQCQTLTHGRLSDMAHMVWKAAAHAAWQGDRKEFRKPITIRVW